MQQARPKSWAMRTSRLAAVLTACVSLTLAAAGCGPGARPDGGTGLLAVGAAAPDVTGTDADGKTVHLSDTRGHAAIVYFYPKDETPGCTKEACAFRDAFTKFTTAGVTIFGVSRDSAA